MLNTSGPQNKNQMSPQDLKNLMIFFALSAILYFGYDFYILKPRAEALRAQAQIQAQAQAQSALLETGIPQTPSAVAEPENFLTREAALNLSTTRLSFKNEDLSGTLDLKGGRIDDLSLQKYFKERGKTELVSVLEPRGQKFFRTIDYGWMSADAHVAVPTAETLWKVKGNAQLSKDAPVTLSWDNGQGLVFEQTLALDEHAMFTVTQRVINNAEKPVKLHPYGLIAQKGTPKDYTNVWVSHEGPVAYIGEELFQTDYHALRKAGKQVVSADKGWLGITDKYWLTTLIPPQGENVQYSNTFSGADVKDKEGKGLYQADFMGTEREIAAHGGKVEVTSHLFVGPKKVLLLEAYEKSLNIPHFDLAVDFGWFWFMTKPFFFALHYLGMWTGNMGVAIIVLTLLIRGSVFPLTNISYRSFAKMKKVGPQVTELRSKFGDDKVKLQQELIKVYEKEGVNPVSGCFPMILQIPIFFALYKTFYVSIELRHAPFFGWIQDLTAPDPTSVFNLFGLIPWNPPTVLLIGVWPCLMLVGMLLQKKLNPPPQDPIQRDMANYMPFMFAYMMSRFASGLVIYWTFSGFITLIQQIIIMKRLGVPVHLFGETEEEKKLETAIEKGVAVHPLIEMAEDDVEKNLFGEAAPKTVSKPKPKPKKKKK